MVVYKCIQDCVFNTFVVYTLDPASKGVPTECKSVVYGVENFRTDTTKNGSTFYMGLYEKEADAKAKVKEFNEMNDKSDYRTRVVLIPVW